MTRNGSLFKVLAPVLRGIALVLCMLSGTFLHAASSADAPVAGASSLLSAQEREWLTHNAASIHVAPETNYPPFSFSQSGVWLGMSSDFLQLIEKRLGVRFQVLPPQNLDAILKQTREGKADLVTSLKSTPERDKFLLFTPPYVKVPTVIVTRNGNALGKWPDAFPGKIVAVGNGYGVQRYLESSYPAIALTLVKDDLDGLRKLAFGEVDAVIMDVASASYFIEQEKITGLRIHSEFEYVYDLSFAVRKELVVLRDVLTKALQEIPEAEKQATLAKWIRLDRNPMALLRARIEPWLPLILLSIAALSSGLVVAFVGRRRRLQEALAASQRLEKANQLLIEQQVFTRTIADALPIMIGYWDADLHCRFANKAYEDSFKIGAPGMVGLPLKDVASAAYLRLHETYMHAALGGKVQMFQREVAQADGATAHQVVRYIPHVLHGQVLGFFVLIEDITELKRAAGSLQALNEELAVQAQAAQNANIAKSAFLANMSHEIRTPLAAISGMARLIRREPLSADQLDRIDKLEAAAKHLSATISDILDLSKIEANKFVLEEAPISIHRLLTSVADIVLESAKEKGLHLRTEIEPISDGLLGDETRLRQALLNFAGNAVKFTEAGSITLRARVQDDGTDSALVRLEVEDTGPGIADTQIPQLFEPFVQADSTTTRKYGGSGLGLAITKRLAQAMGGEVGLTSALGKGSTFWMTVRLSKDAAFDPQQPLEIGSNAADVIRRDFAGLRVLLVDDDAFNREIGEVLLQDVGLQVDMAVDGQQAIEMANHVAYALILMDMQMPKMDGLQATRQLRSMASQSNVPIVAMTANAFKEDRLLCLQAGMNDYVTKPVDPDILYDTLLRHLQKRARST